MFLSIKCLNFTRAYEKRFCDLEFWDQLCKHVLPLNMYI